MIIDTIDFNTYLPKECNGYDKHFDLNYDSIKKELTMDYKSEREHFIIKFDRDEIGTLDNFIKRFANYEHENKDEKVKTITKPLKEFTNTELHNICDHYTCNKCPINILRDDFLGCPFQKSAYFVKDEFIKFAKKYLQIRNRKVTVKESDLKDG